ncbi:MAG: disulfide bond formation protein B [Zoogloeaceae bacterium]|jgi:disulfide bond formation protein DsbB|nr:disulfide bond formation protein B [Zoogloeaceae bacterium]
MKRLSPSVLTALAGLVALGIFGASVGLQHWEEIEPCPLCIFQRFLFLVLGCVLVLLSFTTRKRWGGKLTAILGGLIALGGLATAIYQTIMQAKPGLVPECSFTNPNLIYQFVDWLAYHVDDDLFMATGLCSDKAWTLFGLSLANWSAVAFTGFGVFAIWLWRKRQSA